MSNVDGRDDYDATEQAESQEIEEIKKSVVDSLNHDGTLNSIKAQLKASVFNMLLTQGQSTPIIQPSQSKMQQASARQPSSSSSDRSALLKNSQSLFSLDDEHNRLMALLVEDFLDHCNLKCTKSVMNTELGYSGKEDKRTSISFENLKMQIDQNDSRYDDQSEPLLSKIVSKFLQGERTKHDIDSSVLTSTNDISTIIEKPKPSQGVSDEI